ncbi:MAG: acyl-CoA reductase [Saprospiraceae bacterium]|nr:acyl-CoA reductase [Saprospiraceae bacterium]
MTLENRINALSELGLWLKNLDDERIQTAIRRTTHNNSWFTPENQQLALSEIRDHFLVKNKLKKWLSKYKIDKSTEGGQKGLEKCSENPETSSNVLSSTLQTSNSQLKTVGLVLAGNIPLVGFHDILCVFAAGHRSRIKLSDKDPFLLPMLLDKLKEIDPHTAAYFDTTTDRLKDFDAVIATGSNNSARYFEAYFGKYPHIIRKNRNAVGILRGSETVEELRNLGNDIFQYFGLGCRNVSKLYLPKGYDFTRLLETLHERNALVLHDKYKNNFDYNFTILILNKIKYESNGCILMREAKEIASPISMVYYEFYDSLAEVKRDLATKKEEIQLVVSTVKIPHLPTFKFGEAQKPSLSDYADGVDTMQFLTA